MPVTIIDGQLRSNYAQKAICFQNDFAPLGDNQFHIVGFFMFDTLELVCNENCPAHLKAKIEKVIEPYVGRAGETIELLGVSEPIHLGKSLSTH